MQCSNNLKQLALSQQNHHDVHNSFVALSGTQYGKNTGGGARWRYSGFIGLLSFMEQTALFDQWKDSTCNPAQWADADPVTAPASELRTTKISGFLCPSSNQVYGTREASGTNYRFSLGDAPFSMITANAANDATLTNYANITWNRGIAAFRPQVNGIPGIPFGFSDVTDGTSNTVMFSERVLAEANPGVLRVREGVLNGYNVGGMWDGQNQNASVKLRSQCLLATGSAGEYKNPPPTGAGAFPANYWGECGWKYHDGHPMAVGFSTVIAPNGPACMYRTNRDIGIFTPTSNHPGGVDVARVDGSVTFVSETIDVGTGEESIRNNGATSPYGVWGALGSRNGGEPVSL